jgi:hypothetical protein
VEAIERSRVLARHFRDENLRNPVEWAASIVFAGFASTA